MDFSDTQGTEPITARSPFNRDEVHDLELMLSAGLVSALVLGFLAFLVDATKIINLPSQETLILAALTGLVAAVGWGLLRIIPYPRQLAWGILLIYTVIVTLAVHFTGGPQTPMPSLYLLVIVAAAFVLGRGGAFVIALACGVGYALLLGLEFGGLVQIYPIWGTPFDPKGKGVLFFVNWLAVITPAGLTAYLCGTLAQQLKARNAELKLSEQARQAMTELVVHDLRNPLTVLLGVLDLILMLLGAHFTEDQRRLVENARRSGQMMMGLISDMLDIAKMEAGLLQLKPQALDIQALVRVSAEQVRVYAEREELRLELTLGEPLPRIEADQQLIERVLANLLSNAIKHTSAGGRIAVFTELDHNSFILVRVTDTGEGIPLEQANKIFEKFGQVEQKGYQRRGTGLGLTFCKMAVEAHNGHIWVESALGVGSSFNFRLPLKVAKT
jgi:signal transduction histidine kinase